MAELGVGLTDDDAAVPSDWSQPLVVVTLLWLGGLLLGGWFGSAAGWLVFAAPPLLVSLVMLVRRRWRAVRCWALLALVPVAAGYLQIRLHHVPEHHVRLYVSDRSQLAQLSGTIVSEPVFVTSERGAFGRFSFTPPRTLFVLDAESMRQGDAVVPVCGRVMVKIEQVDRALQRGHRLTLTGWLSNIEGPRNPGEYDYRRRMAEGDIHARLSLPGSDNYELLPMRGGGHWQRWRGRIAGWCEHSLRLGMNPRDRRVAMLQMLLLGSGRQGLGDLDDAFRRTGLTHLLSISGAHLAILMGMVWIVCRMVLANPPRAALLALAILGLYLLAVPLAVPVLRSAIMAAVFGVGYMTGRRLRGLPTLAVACLLTLLWRPGDLWDPGFQLSFGVVAGLLAFTKPVSHWLWPRPLLEVAPPWWWGLARQAVDALAANIVAALVAGPLVAQHFGLVTPLAMVLSFMALPVVVVTLALGYLKIAVGLLFPGVGTLLAEPTHLSARVMAGLVEHAAQWPGSTVVLDQAPGWLWTLAATALVAAMLGGWFAQRRATLTAAVCVCTLWLVIAGSARPIAQSLVEDAQRPAAIVNMFDVGNGSCFLVRLYPAAAEGRKLGGLEPYTIMFDCGSQEYLDVGERSIVPALRTLGVRQIDVMILSHADLDHFGGSLDVIDGIPVRQVWISPQMLADAQADPRTVEGFLLEGLQQRGMEVRTVSAGHRQQSGGAELEILWPLAGWRAPRHNDMSLVLSVRVAGRRLLLSGDVQQRAMPEMLARQIDLRADVAELPHHGSFVDASPAWLEAVRPALALQSSGVGRLESDPWPPHLERWGVRRLVTATMGMCEVAVRRNGQMEAGVWDERANSKEKRGGD